MAFYVVFEGRTCGVFDSCTHCLKAVDGLIGKTYERYDTYEAAVTAWQSYCQVKGYGKAYFQERLLQPERLIHRKSASTSSANVLATTSNTTQNIDEATTSMVDATVVHGDHALQGHSNTVCTDWIIKYNMQQQLQVMCTYLSIQPAVYTRDYLHVRKGIPYFRYKVSLALGGVESFTCYGRYSKCEEDAKEDATFVAMRWLLNITGQKVRDFNFYNARELEQKIHFVESENIQLSNINRSLKEELDRLRSERSGNY